MHLVKYAHWCVFYSSLIPCPFLSQWRMLASMFACVLPEQWFLFVPYTKTCYRLHTGKTQYRFMGNSDKRGQWPGMILFEWTIVSLLLGFSIILSMILADVFNPKFIGIFSENFCFLTPIAQQSEFISLHHQLPILYSQRDHHDSNYRVPFCTISGIREQYQALWSPISS